MALASQAAGAVPSDAGQAGLLAQQRHEEAPNPCGQAHGGGGTGTDTLQSTAAPAQRGRASSANVSLQSRNVIRRAYAIVMMSLQSTMACHCHGSADIRGQHPAMLHVVDPAAWFYVFDVCLGRAIDQSRIFTLTVTSVDVLPWVSEDGRDVRTVSTCGRVC